MKRFLCICLSPAIDATVRLDAWPTDGCVIKNAADILLPGGKAVNVARYLALNGESVACGGLVGEDNAVLFEKELAKFGVEDRFVRVLGSTRVNEMFVTPTGSFKVNRAAFPGLAADDLLDQIARFDGFDSVILSGSLPKDWPADVYRTLVAAAKTAGARVVLDTSGKSLTEGVKARPDVIKPNAEECLDLIGFQPKMPEDFGRATAALKAFCDFPIISDGADGCWFDGEFVPAPRVEVLDTTAAGDTLLAEWCRSGDPKRAVAAGSAACTMPGGEPPPAELIERLIDR